MFVANTDMVGGCRSTRRITFACSFCPHRHAWGRRATRNYGVIKYSLEFLVICSWLHELQIYRREYVMVRENVVTSVVSTN